MRFAVMHKMTAELEKGLPPSPEEMEGVGRMIGEAAKANVFLGGEGLKPSAQRLHIAYSGGSRQVTRGPFADPRELVGGFALLRVQSMEEAVRWCDRFAEALGDVELFLGPIVENWDLGFGPKPDDAPLRVLSMHKADARSEAGLPPEPAVMARMGALVEEMTLAGVLESATAFAPTRSGARIRFEGGKASVIDGPFAESKELVAGYALLELPSLQEAIAFSIPFGELVRVNEIEIRVLA